MILTHYDVLELLEWIRSFDSLNRGHEVPAPIRDLEKKLEAFQEESFTMSGRASKLAEEEASINDRYKDSDPSIDDAYLSDDNSLS